MDAGKRAVAFNSPSARLEAKENTMFLRACRNAGPFFFVTYKSHKWSSLRLICASLIVCLPSRPQFLKGSVSE